jgi:hypothetical protein
MRRLEPSADRRQCNDKGLTTETTVTQGERDKVTHENQKFARHIPPLPKTKCDANYGGRRLPLHLKAMLLLVVAAVIAPVRSSNFSVIWGNNVLTEDK